MTDYEKLRGVRSKTLAMFDTEQQKYLDPRRILAAFMANLLAAGAKIVFNDDVDPLAIPIIADERSFAISAEILRKYGNPDYIAFGPFGTHPAITASDRERAEEIAIGKIRDMLGPDGKILIRECWSL
ncbi:MAG: hypothetical protein ACR2QH_15160 [Geminicoccaceae bacterium]